MDVWQSLKRSVHRPLDQWKTTKVPSSRQVRLSNSSIFIFPTKMGFVFLILIVLMFVLAANFQNVLIKALAFFLISLVCISLYHTYRNLSRIRLIAVPAPPCFVGDTLKLQVRLCNAVKKSRYQIQFRWQLAHVVDVMSKTEQQVVLDYPAKCRGVCQPESLRVSTQYPFGLLEAWTWVDLVYDVLVYPKPIKEPFRYVNVGCDHVHVSQANHKGLDDFRGFRAYQVGDSLKQIAWKQVARGRGLLTKEFDDPLEHTHWLDWEAMVHEDAEYRLSVLCGWVLASYELNYQYGLRLPNQVIEPSKGGAHRDRCLKALALHSEQQTTLAEEKDVDGGSL